MTPGFRDLISNQSENVLHLTRFQMVKGALEAAGMRNDMKGVTPPMFRNIPTKQDMPTCTIVEG